MSNNLISTLDLKSLFEDLEGLLIKSELLFWSLQKLDRRRLNDDALKNWFRLLSEKTDKIINNTSELESLFSNFKQALNL
jgi:hypothetical protein